MVRTQLSCGSLFCGCGGFDLGFLDAGFRCVAAFDIDPLAIMVHRKNLNSPAEICDLSQGPLPIDALRRIDVLLAGPPCQGFSTAGNRNPSDPRNGLLLTAGRIAVRAQPKVVLVENVAGVVAGAQRAYWEKLFRILRQGGYSVTELRCDGTSMGVPQKRRRVVALGWRDGKMGKVVLPEVAGSTLRRALSGINGAPNHMPRRMEPGSLSERVAARIRPGQKLSNVREGPHVVHTWEIPEVYGKTTKQERRVLEGLLRRRRQKRLRDFGDADPVTAQALRHFLGCAVADTLGRLIAKGFVRRVGRRYDLTHTFNGKFRRLPWDEPAPTVDTRFGDPWYFLHPKEDRAFTVRETARIQGFPDWFTFDGVERSQYRLIGNAVPPPAANLLAKYIRASLLARK